jgi:hypothetical protein
VSIGDATPRVFSPWARLSAVVAHGEATASPGGVEVWLLQGRLDLCPLRLGGQRFFASPCAGLGAGPLFSRGVAVAAPRRQASPWVSAEAAVHLQWNATSRFFVEGEGGVTIPILLHRFFVEPDTTLYTLPRIAARAGLGAGVLF